MSKRHILDQRTLHSKFILALEDRVVWYSDVDCKPLDMDLLPPLPLHIRVYLFNATHPPGGRTLGEHKIQLMVPGQKRGEKGSFDESGGRIIVLAGYQPDVDVFILWDAGLYPEFSYSRNVQVKAETVYDAIAGKIGVQQRRIRSRGVEKVLTARPDRLKEALVLRMEYTRMRLLEELRNAYA